MLSFISPPVYFTVLYVHSIDLTFDFLTSLQPRILHNSTEMNKIKIKLCQIKAQKTTMTAIDYL